MSKRKISTISEDTTPAAATLAPNSMPAEGGQTRASMMSAVMAGMSGMSKSDLIAFFEASMAQFGPGVDLGVPNGMAERNMQSIAAKAAPINEDVEAMFAGQDLSEEFKTKVAGLFEAAVTMKTSLLEAELKDRYEAEFDQLLESTRQDLSEQVDQYLSYAVEQWADKNKLAVEQGIKYQLYEDFFRGVSKLFTEHNIDLPENAIDVIAIKDKEIEELKEHYDAQIKENAVLAQRNTNLERASLLNEAASTLTALERTKLIQLTESVAYTDPDTFKTKINVIKETYFGHPSVGQQSLGTSVESGDGVQVLTEEDTKPQQQLAQNPSMNRYVSAIDRTVRS